VVTDPLVIYEAGGGSGTNALSILSYIQQAAPEVYATLQYTLIEISESMAERQRERVCSAHPKAEVIVADVCTWGERAQGRQIDYRPCFFIRYLTNSKCTS
jgi:SAM-dependent MidA family methyltransferase